MKSIALLGEAMTHVESSDAENLDDFAPDAPSGRPGMSARKLINIVTVLVALIAVGVGARYTLSGNPTWLQRIFPYTGSRVYVVPEDRHAVMALKADDGTPLWTFTLPTPPVSAGATPITGVLLDGDTLDVVTATETGAAVIAIDTRDGTARWRYQTLHASIALLTVAGGSVFVAEEGEQDDASDLVLNAALTVLDAHSGKPRWTYRSLNTGTLTFAYTPQTILVGENNALATNSTPGALLVALAAADGTLRWHLSVTDSLALYPTIANDSVYIRADHALAAYALRDGTRQWQQMSAPPLLADYPVLTADLVTVTDDDGNIAAFSTTGALQWQADTHAPHSIAAHDENGAYVDSSIFTADDNTYGLTALNLSDGTTRWRYTMALPDAFAELPLLAGKTIYLHLADAMVALDIADGHVRWHTSVARPPGGTAPALAQSTLYLGAGNSVVALNASTGTIRWQRQVGYVALTPLIGA